MRRSFLMPALQKRPCCYRSVGRDGWRIRRLLRRVAYGGGNAAPPIACVHMQPVHIAGNVDISETGYHVALNSDNGEVFKERTVPRLKLHAAGGSRAKLLGSIVRSVYSTHRIINNSASRAQSCGSYFLKTIIHTSLIKTDGR